MNSYDTSSLNVSVNTHNTIISMKVDSYYSNLLVHLYKIDDILHIAIPAYEVACTLSYPSDFFWNTSLLARVLGNDVDATMIAVALKHECDCINQL